MVPGPQNTLPPVSSLFRQAPPGRFPRLCVTCDLSSVLEVPPAREVPCRSGGPSPQGLGQVKGSYVSSLGGHVPAEFDDGFRWCAPS